MPQRLRAGITASRLGLSAPFFKSGWGDLGVVTFEEAESLLKGWPPEHFDTKVVSKAPLQHRLPMPSEEHCQPQANHSSKLFQLTLQHACVLCRWTGHSVKKGQSMTHHMNF